MTWRTEREFQQLIIDYAELLRWRVYHVAKVKRHLRAHSSPGFPDLVLLRGGRCIAAEVKVGTNCTTRSQRAWLSTWSEIPGCHAVLWRPDAPTLHEQWRVVETAEGADLGAIGRRLRQHWNQPCKTCLLYTSPSPRDRTRSRMPSSA